MRLDTLYRVIEFKLLSSSDRTCTFYSFSLQIIPQAMSILCRVHARGVNLIAQLPNNRLNLSVGAPGPSGLLAQKNTLSNVIGEHWTPIEPIAHSMVTDG
jgi:hypothetical protein